MATKESQSKKPAPFRETAARLMRESKSIKNEGAKRYLVRLAAKWLDMAQRCEESSRPG